MAEVYGTMVQATNLSTIRVEVLGESRAVTAPAGVWLEAMRLYRERMAEQEAGGDAPDGPRVTVADARALCEKGGKGWAVLILGTAESTQFVTWGRTAEQKVYASGLSEHLSGHLGCGPVAEVHESYTLDAARNKARAEQLESAMREIAGQDPGGAAEIARAALAGAGHPAPARLGITEAMELCRQGKRVRPVSWRGEALPRWVESRPWCGVGGGVIFMERQELSEELGPLGLQWPAEFFGEWEVVE